MTPATERLIAVSVGEDDYSRRILRGVADYAQSKPHWSFARLDVVPMLPEAMLADWRGDGVIGRFRDLHMPTQLARRGIAVVNVSHRCEVPGITTVGPDDHAIGRLGADYLLGRGLFNLAFVGFTDHLYAQHRQEGFQQRAREAGIECSVWLAHAGAAEAAAHDSVGDWLAQLPRPMGLMACSDVRARHVVLQCSRVSLRIPDDVALLGVDNDEWQMLLARIPISSVDPDARTIGTLAAEELENLMQGRSTPGARRLVAPRGVISRQSTDIVSSTDAVVARAVELIRQTCREPVLLDEIAARAGVSRRTLELRCRRSLGRTPQQLLWQCRIDLARRLLLEAPSSLKEIAEACGFASTSQFSAVFTRHTGVPPGRYRERFRR